MYLTALDHEQHIGGPLGSNNPAALRVLERIDMVIGRLADAARRVAGNRAVIAVVSDHGFAPAHREGDLLPLLHGARLIDADSTGWITAWRAGIWPAGGSVAVVLEDRNDEGARTRVRAMIDLLAADSNSGTARVADRAELAPLGAFPGDELVIAPRPGFTAGTELVTTVTRPSSVRGMHGYWPTVLEMRASLFLAGGDVPRGKQLGEIDMRSIAPTLAALLGVTLPAAELRPRFAPAPTRP